VIKIKPGAREAEFLTRRAQKLAPDNGDVKRLGDEAVRLLKLKTN